MHKIKFIIAAVLLGAIAMMMANASSKKPHDSPAKANKQLQLELSNISVSGVSSGGYMANQFHLAHSDWVDKVGIIAAGPYFCAQNSIKIALERCVNTSTEDTTKALSLAAQNYQKQGKIAELSHLKNSKVWIFSGSKDKKIIPDVTQALYQQYTQWLAPENIQFINDKPFAHHVPTLAFGSACDVSVSPYLGNCNYDAAGEMLGYLYAQLSPRVDKPQGKLISFNQLSLGGEPAQSLAETGYVYVPESCQQGQSCQVHVNFHGCQQNAEAVGQEYVLNNGLNNWAETNQLVVLYPQTKNSMFMPLNPQGCWDWWGYSGQDYANQEGLQIQAVKNMVFALSEQLTLKDE